MKKMKYCLKMPSLEKLVSKWKHWDTKTQFPHVPFGLNASDGDVYNSIYGKFAV